MTEPADALRLDLFLCFSLYSATHAMQRVYAPMLADLGITYPQYLALVALWQQDDQTVGALGQHLLLESSTLTPMLKRLEAAGLVSRARDSHDERQVRVRLTEAGQALRARAAAVPGCVLEAIGLPLKELVPLKQQLDLLRARLETACEALSAGPNAGA